MGNPFGSSDDNQRLWNLMILHVPLTDEEIDRMTPFFGCLALLIVLLVLGYFLVTKGGK